MFLLVWGFSVQENSFWRLPFNNLCQVAILVDFVHAFINVYFASWVFLRISIFNTLHQVAIHMASVHVYFGFS